MPSMLPVSSACSDIRRRGEFIEHLLDASALGCASCVRFAPKYRSFGLSLRDPKSSHSLSTLANSGRGERQWDILSMIARD